MSAFQRRLSLAFSFILLLASPCAAEPAQGHKYNIINLNSRISLEKFASYLRASDPSAPRIHSTGLHSFIVMTVQEGDILKAALFPPECIADREGPFVSKILYLKNPERRSFAGMEAESPTADPDHVIFEDGTELRAFPSDPYPPADAYFTGEVDEYSHGRKVINGRRFHLQWRRVYGNYYFVAKYSQEVVLAEYLITEENGKDLRPLLGESSAEPHPDFTTCRKSIASDADLAPYFDATDHDGKRIRYKIKVVQEKDLPPDFPKGLVRWLP